MVNVRSISMWKTSISMMFGKSPKIQYLCGKCGAYNKTRIDVMAVKVGKPYVICNYCGEVNNTGLVMN